MSQKEEVTWGDLVTTVRSGNCAVDIEEWKKRLQKLRRKRGIEVDQHRRVSQTLDLLKYSPNKEEQNHEESSSDSCIDSAFRFVNNILSKM